MINAYVPVIMCGGMVWIAQQVLLLGIALSRQRHAGYDVLRKVTVGGCFGQKLFFGTIVLPAPEKHAGVGTVGRPFGGYAQQVFPQLFLILCVQLI
jgi:hypothetical protein